MPARSRGEASRERLFVSLKNLILTLLAIGKTRAELLVTEVEEEKLRLMSLWAKAVGALFLFAVGLMMLVAFIALIFWEQRILVFGMAAGLFLVTGLLLVSALRRQIAQPSKLFRASLTELETDMAQLRQATDKQ
ncbi:MAG: phage holin family protein [Candidatus Dechloromonas phosphoritropha]|nr:phage holin family protein [Candidatus Dechloromonas phosphoritropha]MBP8786435.1 phage holin family protein [Azonexus sp.]MBP9226983.1 phage holin family protein [Azonexus sp.]